MTRARATTRSPGFTLIELLFGIAVVFLLIGLLIAGLRFATRATRGQLDTQAAAALKVAVEQFKQQFAFFPPLVKDRVGGSFPILPGPPKRVLVFDLQDPADVLFLRTPPANAAQPDERFSVYTLAYYVMGALEVDVDGKAGFGFTEPTRDGRFALRGPVFGPYFDTGRNPRAVFAADPDRGVIELRDSNNVSYRYYRWLNDAGAPNPSNPLNDYLNVPDIVGDPATSPEVRNAQYAIVGAGPNGLFGDEYKLPTYHPQYVPLPEMQRRLGIAESIDGSEAERRAREDNVVEVGR